jgi:hypothetical protein
MVDGEEAVVFEGLEIRAFGNIVDQDRGGFRIVFEDFLGGETFELAREVCVLALAEFHDVAGLDVGMNQAEFEGFGARPFVD